MMAGPPFSACVLRRTPFVPRLRFAAMPELPDITVYLEALERRILGQVLLRVRVNSPFLLRTFEPPLSAVAGKRVRGLKRIGKRIAIGLDNDLWVVVHLMIAGRLHLRGPRAKLSGRNKLSTFPMDRWYSRRRGPDAALRCTWSEVNRGCMPWMQAASTFRRVLWRSF